MLRSYVGLLVGSPEKKSWSHWNILFKEYKEISGVLVLSLARNKIIPIFFFQELLLLAVLGSARKLFQPYPVMAPLENVPDMAGRSPRDGELVLRAR